ncbi:hypothetical protein TNIN_301681 [Trichonephila inaurata madagascariensis]|uniref:Uncharacterized protein n=1 Tax=Trichonephila inaurata madagascariensis TaxID=2747483 RepID=A0A8X6YV80_9ARAC|nr:hypothetical protein TNIN_301681 [Trichonephila inaurata madagascariensis]
MGLPLNQQQLDILSGFSLMHYSPPSPIDTSQGCAQSIHPSSPMGGGPSDKFNYVSLDPRPVVIPILSSVIGFPIVVFALICALRHRAMKLRRRDQLKKLQSGISKVITMIETLRGNLQLCKMQRDRDKETLYSEMKLDQLFPFALYKAVLFSSSCIRPLGK